MAHSGSSMSSLPCVATQDELAIRWVRRERVATAEVGELLAHAQHVLDARAQRVAHQEAVQHLTGVKHAVPSGGGYVRGCCERPLLMLRQQALNKPRAQKAGEDRHFRTNLRRREI
eukprot:3346042-Pleurochrysis_carterae.AAC.2